jgi:hypothetical protein
MLNLPIVCLNYLIHCFHYQYRYFFLQLPVCALVTIERWISFQTLMSYQSIWHQGFIKIRSPRQQLRPLHILRHSFRSQGIPQH